jgi:hypothetical protein
MLQRGGRRFSGERGLRPPPLEFFSLPQIAACILEDAGGGRGEVDGLSLAAQPGESDPIGRWMRGARWPGRLEPGYLEVT